MPFNGLPPGIAGYAAGQELGQRRDMAQMQQLQGILGLQQMLEQRQMGQQQQQAIQELIPQLTNPEARMMAQLGDIKGALARQFPDAGASFGKIDAKDYSPESLAKFSQSRNFADLVPVRKRESVTTADATGAPVTSFVDPYAQIDPLKQPVKREMVNLGGTMAPVNPYTQNLPMQRTVSPDASLSANVAMRGQNMTDARSREGLAQGKTQYDADRGVVVNLGTGQAAPVMGPGGALGQKPSAGQQNDLRAIDQQEAVVKGAIDAVKANPSAFTFKRGLATMAGPLAESGVGRFDKPEEQQARSYVFNIVSKVINERAGAAQSAQELARLRSFLPAETDSPDQITNKLTGFQTYLSDQRAGTTGTPRQPNAFSGPDRRQAPTGFKVLGVEGR